MVHNKLHYVTRPLRILISIIIPYLTKVHLDILHMDCLIPNPLISGVDGCPCFYTKYPLEITLNYSELPSHLLNPGNVDVHILRNCTHLRNDFSIDTLISFPALHNGVKPSSCMDIPGQNSPIYGSYEFFNSQKMHKALRNKQPWSFTW